MGSWKIKRGVKTNRVTKSRATKGPTPATKRPDQRRGRKIESRDKRIEYSPQRAKIRQRGGEKDVWTSIAICIRVEDLLTIDEHADSRDMSRSRFMVDAALLAAGHLPRELARLGEK